MNILMVTMAMHIGGAETHILELCRALQKRGHTVMLASDGGVYADQLEKEGVPQVRLPLHTKAPAAVWKSYRGLEACIRDGQFDIVHAHARIPAWICGKLWDKRPFRFVTTAHLNFSLNPLWRRISRWGERTMAVSDDIVDYLVDGYNAARDRIYVTINGIDMEKFSPDVPYDAALREWGLSTGHDRLRLVYMSRLDTDRAAYAFTIARIAPALAKKYPNLDVIIVGGGNEEAKIRRLAEEANRQAGRQLVTMTGATSDTNLYTAAADVFVGVSRSALEAMSAGCPVIVAGNQGVLGIFDEEKLTPAMDTNFCCRGYPAWSDEQMLEAVDALLAETPQQRCARGEWCRSIIRQYYTADRMAADYEKMYADTLASPIPFRGTGDVVLSGYYGFGNLGDESLLSVISSTLAKEAPGVRITALTRHPRRDRRLTGLHCVSRTNLPAIARELRHARLFVSGGGSLLQDVTSWKSLRYYLALMEMAQRRGVPTCVYANGIGPIRRNANRAAAAKVVQNSTSISVRDPESAAELVRLGIPAEKIYTGADPAFLLTVPSGDRLRRTLHRLGMEQGNYFLISLRRTNDKAADAQLSANMATFARRLWESTRLYPVFVAMQPQNDRDICAQTLAAAALPPDCGATMVLPETVQDMQSLAVGARLTVGMRLHSLIYAASAGVPVIGISYDPKIDALLQALGQTYLVPAANVTADTLQAFALEILSAENDIRNAIRAAAAVQRERAAEDAARLAARCR